MESKYRYAFEGTYHCQKCGAELESSRCPKCNNWIVRLDAIDSKVLWKAIRSIRDRELQYSIRETYLEGYPIGTSSKIWTDTEMKRFLRKCERMAM